MEGGGEIAPDGVFIFEKMPHKCPTCKRQKIRKCPLRCSSGGLKINWPPLCQIMCPSDGVACRHSVASRGESERKARTANQLILTLPVAKKRSMDCQSGQRVYLIGQIEQE